MNSTPLFDCLTGPDGRETIRPHYADSEDVPRLSGQNGAILAMLEALRPGDEITNIEVGQMLRILPVSTRMSNVRQHLERYHGKTVKGRRGDKGVWFYSIQEVER